MYYSGKASEWSPPFGEIFSDKGDKTKGWFQRHCYLSQFHIKQEGVQHDIARKMGDRERTLLQVFACLVIILLCIAPLVTFMTYSAKWKARLEDFYDSVATEREQIAPGRGGKDILKDITQSHKMCDEFGIVSPPEIFGAIKITAMNFVVVALVGIPPPAGVKEEDWAHAYKKGEKTSIRVKRFFAIYNIGNCVLLYFFVLKRVFTDPLFAGVSAWYKYEIVLVLTCLNPSITSIAQFAIRLSQSAIPGQEQAKWLRASLCALFIYGIPAWITHALPMLFILLSIVCFSFVSPFIGIGEMAGLWQLDPDAFPSFNWHSSLIVSLMSIIGVIEMCFLAALTMHAILYGPIHFVHALVGKCSEVPRLPQPPVAVLDVQCEKCRDQEDDAFGDTTPRACKCRVNFKEANGARHWLEKTKGQGLEWVIADKQGDEHARVQGPFLWNRVTFTLSKNGKRATPDLEGRKLLEKLMNTAPGTNAHVTDDEDEVKKGILPANTMVRIKANAGPWYKSRGFSDHYCEFTGRWVAPGKPVWLFHNGQQMWLPYRSGFYGNLDTHNVSLYAGRIEMMKAKFNEGLPSTRNALLWTTVTNFVLQIFVLYAILFYNGDPMYEIPVREFNARNFGEFVHCAIHHIEGGIGSKLVQWTGNL